MGNAREPLPVPEALKWNEDGLIPAIVQDAETGAVLMLAWMDQLSLRETVRTGQTHFYSRSRRSHWHKGGTSGHVQHVDSIWIDCDGDVILIKARQVGGACHEGYRSCFFRRLGNEGWEVAALPVFDPAKIYASMPEAPGGSTTTSEPRTSGATTPVPTPEMLDVDNHLAAVRREMPD